MSSGAHVDLLSGWKPTAIAGWVLTQDRHWGRWRLVGGKQAEFPRVTGLRAFPEVGTDGAAGTCSGEQEPGCHHRARSGCSNQASPLKKLLGLLILK